MDALTVPGKLDSLDEITAFVLQAAQKAKLDQRRRYFLRLAVDEIATNIILHGYSGQPIPGKLHLMADIDSAYLTIYLEDTGANYDPAQAVPQTPPKVSPQDQGTGGLGTYLALYGVDQFQYKRVGGRNRSVFRVELDRGHGIIDTEHNHCPQQDER